MSALLALAAGVLASVASAAHADGVAAPVHSSVVVTRLTVSGDTGWLTLQARIGADSVTGFEVVVPAEGGSWSGTPDVEVSDLGVHCRLLAGPALHYLCGSADDHAVRLPPGGYQVPLRVSRQGFYSRTSGTVSVDTDDGSGQVTRHDTDTFPVLRGDHFRSTAEVRTAPTTPDADGQGGSATVAVTTTIPPLEAVTALDVSLPSGGWKVLGSNAATHSARCGIAGAGNAEYLHCVPTAAAGGSLPNGRYHLVTTLHFTDQPDPLSEVSLTALGGTPDVMDTFSWAPTATG